MRFGFNQSARLEKQSKQVGFSTKIISVLCYGFLVLPSLIVIPMSFSGRDEVTFPPPEWSLYLYQQFFSDPSWYGSAIQSAVVAFWTVILSVILGVSAAYGLTRGEFKGKSFLAIAFISPMLIPVIVISLSLYLYFNYIQIHGSTLSIVIGHTMLATPFVIITVLSAMKNIDPIYEKAAYIMGAGRLYVVRTVIVPLLMPAVIVSGLFAFLISFDEVVIAWFLASSDTATLPVKMYSSIRWEVSPVLAAVSAMLTLMSIVVCGVAAFAKRNER